MMRCAILTLAVPFLVLLAACADMTGSTSTQTDAGPAESKTSESGEKAGSDPASDKGEESTSLADVGQKMSEAAQVTGEFSAEQMRKFTETMQTRVQEMGDTIDALSREGEELAGEAKKEWQEKLTAIKEERQQLQAKLTQLQDASGDAWQRLQKGVSGAWTELQQAIDDAKADTQQSSRTNDVSSTGNGEGDGE